MAYATLGQHALLVQTAFLTSLVRKKGLYSTNKHKGADLKTLWFFGSAPLNIDIVRKS